MKHDINDVIKAFNACLKPGGAGCANCPYLDDCIKQNDFDSYASSVLADDINEILLKVAEQDPRLLVDPMHLNVFARKLMDMETGESLHVAKSQDNDRNGVDWYNVTKCMIGDLEDETIFEFVYCGSEDYFYAMGTGPEDIMQVMFEKGFGAYVFIAKCE